ncbi:hypothetical protein J28TS4_15960 [Paenibacillus lautus]|nr:hypothetical protein J28TS4_15960 [Paenibacillus lautus]
MLAEAAEYAPEPSHLAAGDFESTGKWSLSNNYTHWYVLPLRSPSTHATVEAIA